MTINHQRLTNQQEMEITMENAITIVLEEIDIITNEQIKMIKYNDELEDRRLRLLKFVERNENLNISKMENQIKSMEMKLSINGVTDQIKEKVEIIDDSLQKKKFNQKCRYNDRGFCKSRLECVYSHANTNCEQHLSNGQCPESKTCPLRHPRDCKHWTGDNRGCLRGDICKYLHNSSKKGINVKTNKNNHETKSGGQIGIIDKDKESTEEKDDTLNETIAVKDKVIKEQNEEIIRLRSENESIIEQNDRMKRIAVNMDKEIKVLRSKLN